MEITFTLTSTQAAAMFLRLTNTGHTLPEGIIAHARELRTSAPQRAAAATPAAPATTPAPEPPAAQAPQPAAAGSSGMFDNLLD